MQLFSSSYFNFYTIGSFLPAVFASFLGLFFLTVPKKSAATKWMAWSFLLMSLFFFPYAPAASIYDPAGAYHRWFTVPFVLFSMLCIPQVLLRFPEDDFPRLANWLLRLQLAIAVGATAFFFYRTSSAAPIYHFDGHYWDFDADLEGRIIGYVIQAFIVTYLLAGVFKAIVTPSPYRWFIAVIALGYVLGTAPAGLTNVLSRDGALDRGTHQISMVLTSVTFFFVSVIVFINTIKDRTTFMGKIVGISLVTFLIVMQFMSFYALQSLDTAYDSIHQKEAELVLRDPNRRPPELRYVAVLGGPRATLEFEYPKGGAPVALAERQAELRNTVLRARIEALPKSDLPVFKAAVEKIIDRPHPEFSGYAGFLQEALAKIPADSPDPKAALLAQLDDVRRKILFRYNKLRQLPDEDFRQAATKFIKAQPEYFAPFRRAIEAYMEVYSDQQGAELKSGVLAYLMPVQSGGTRVYRKHTRKDKASDQFIAYQIVAADGSVVREVGFSYLAYRQYVHGPSMKIFIVLSLGILMVLVGFRFFFAGALVRPLDTLLEGVERVNVGDLTVQVPVKVQDEIGFLTESFNSMVATVKDGRDNLEQKVADRTRELSETLQQVQKLKTQQDGDYFLTSLLIKPLGANHAGEGGPIAVDFFVKQKKTFEFRKWKEEIGGDLNKAHRIRLKGKDHIIFLNADAMGKSVQGAGGILVLGSVFESMVERTQMSSAVSDQYPERWLKNAFIELQKVFESFNGSMLVSLVMGLVDEETGIMYYINAEHPFSVLYRGGKARFIEDELTFRKLGTTGVEGSIFVRTIQLEPGDVVIAGTDGRDDILLGFDERGNRIINEDEAAFLRHVEGCDANLDKIYSSLLEVGEITDDLALIRVGYRETAHAESHDHAISREIIGRINDSRAKRKAGQLGEALAALEKANELDNSRPAVIYELLKFHLDQRDFAKAASYAEDYIYLRPGDTEVVYIASVCFRKAGDLDRAADLGERVRLRSPRAVKNLLNLAKIYASLNNLSRAEMLADDVLQLDPDNTPATKIKMQLAELKARKAQ